MDAQKLRATVAPKFTVRSDGPAPYWAELSIRQRALQGVKALSVLAPSLTTWIGGKGERLQMVIENFGEMSAFRLFLSLRPILPHSLGMRLALRGCPWPAFRLHFDWSRSDWILRRASAFFGWTLESLNRLIQLVSLGFEQRENISHWHTERIVA